MIDGLLKALKEKAQELSNNHWGDDERHLIGKGIQCMYVQAENIIRSHTKNSEWIPCSERLPEGMGKVLVSKNGNVLEDMFEFQVSDEDEKEEVMEEFGISVIGYFTSKSDDSIGVYADDSNSIAWQPLPAPYEVKSDE